MAPTHHTFQLLNPDNPPDQKLLDRQLRPLLIEDGRTAKFRLRILIESSELVHRILTCLSRGDSTVLRGQ